MKNSDKAMWEKLIIFLVTGLILIQGGFFEDSYLLIGGCIAFLMLNEKQCFCGDTKLTFGIVAISAFCILYHLVVEKTFLVGYMLCFLIIYVLAMQRKDLLEMGIFYGIIVMEIIGMMAYLGIDIGGIVRNNRFMGTFQYANTTAIILAFAIVYLKECDDKIYCRYQLLNYIFLFLTYSVGGIGSYILASVYCLLKGKAPAKVWIKELMSVFVSLFIAAMVYLSVFVLNINFLSIVFFTIAMVISWKWEEITDKIIENLKHVKLILTIIGIIIIGVSVISFISVISDRAIETFKERIWQMQDGLNVLKNNLFTGVGSDGWKNNLLTWRTHAYEVNIIHNSYLHIGVKYGIVILVMMFLLSIYLLYCSRRWTKFRQVILYVGMLHAFFDIDFFFMGYCSFLLLDISEEKNINEKKLEKKGGLLKSVFCGTVSFILLFNWLIVIVKKFR